MARQVEVPEILSGRRDLGGRSRTGLAPGRGVIVVAPRPLTRLGLCELISRDSELWLEHETADINDACEAARLGGSGITLIDLEERILDTSVLDVLADAGRHVVVLSANDRNVKDLLSRGVSAVIARDRSPSQIVIEIRAVLNGATIVSIQSGSLEELRTTNTGKHFTVREVDVLRELVVGQTNREIGRLLGITEATVKFHVRNLARKLEACSRTEIAYRAGQDYWFYAPDDSSRERLRSSGGARAETTDRSV